MKRQFYYISLLLLTMTTLMTTSCREDSSIVNNYGHPDVLAFHGADTSFVAQFDGLWMGLSANYALWDFEAEKGLDWDAVRVKYRPLFEALDKRDKNTNPITDEELTDLYGEFCQSLHDGHLGIQVLNHHTGKHLFVPTAGSVTTEKREDYVNEGDDKPSFEYYTTAAAGKYKAVYCDCINTTPGVVNTLRMNVVKEYLKRDIEAQQSAIDYLTKLGQPISAELLNSLNDSKKALDEFTNKPNQWKSLVEKYAYMGISDIPQEHSLSVVTANFDGNILYFSFSGFHLSTFILENGRAALGDGIFAQPLAEAVTKAWQYWHDTIYDLHRKGQLKGVIIDVRHNGGGSVGDYPLVLGALQEPGGQQLGEVRYKTGVGRYDYSPLAPFVVETQKGDYDNITEPIVVLANSHSVSMSEMTSRGVKLLPNGKLIGTRTYGGMCGLTGPFTNYSLTYASSIGVRDESPFYAYIPVCAAFYDGKIMEGEGMTPDIEVPFDADSYEATGRDNQLERAIDYIRNGQ